MEVKLESRARERSFGKVVNANDREEELALFLEMRRRDKEKSTGFLLLPPSKNADELDAIAAAAPPESDNRGGAAVSRTVGAVPVVPPRKSRVDEFLNSENEKSDYNWLLTPPSTPLFPSLDMEVQKTTTNQTEVPNDRVSAPKSRLANYQLESASRNNITSKQPTSLSRLNSSSTGNRRPSTPGGSGAATRRSTTPTGRSTTPTGRSTLPSSTKPSRSSTPNSRATSSSAKLAAPPVRSSTPSRSTPRSSTPTGRPSASASKSTSRSATPTRQPSSSSASAVSAPPGRSSSASKLRPTSSKTPVSNDAPPNLRTSLPQRPASASRDRPVAPSVKTSSVVAGCNGKPRQQSCSPSRARASNVSTATSGNSHRVISRASSHDSDDVNPVLMGTQMVERVVNSRRLAPPKQYDHYTTLKGSAGKPSSSESSGFGRNWCKVNQHS